MWFDKKSPEELYPPKDEYQRKYRQAFEDVYKRQALDSVNNDKFLIYERKS